MREKTDSERKKFRKTFSISVRTNLKLKERRTTNQKHSRTGPELQSEFSLTKQKTRPRNDQTLIWKSIENGQI